MSSDEYVASAAQLQPGSIVGHDGFAVGNNGELFAVSRKCRHLGADLAEGAIDAQGCLVCPWHGAAYKVETGHMVRGPGGVFGKVPGLGTTFKLMTRVLPLRRREALEREGKVYLRSR